MEITEIRRKNLSVLMGQYRTQKELATRLGMAPTFLSQLKSGPQQDGSGRNIGNDLARSMEKKLGLPRGWMDQPQGWSAEDKPQTSGATLDIGHGIPEEDIPLLMEIVDRFRRARRK